MLVIYAHATAPVRDMGVFSAVRAYAISVQYLLHHSYAIIHVYTT